MTQWGLDTLFNPAKRHMDEEKRRLQSTREEVGDNSGGKRIDFESGKVVITRANDESDEAADGPADDATTDTAETNEDAVVADKRAADKSAAPKSTAPKSTAPKSTAPKSTAPKAGADKPAPSAAAIRAAQRRGRLPR